MKATIELSNMIGDLKTACATLGVPRANFYRFKNQNDLVQRVQQPLPPLALSVEEKSYVLSILNSERFVDQSPYEVYATLLDEGKYYCSIRTMYRILEEANEVRERRHQRRHGNYKKPELLATATNQVWSWDITKLKGPKKWTYFFLYTILDIFSRYVVGWMVAERETATLAEQLIEETCLAQKIERHTLTIHADRGSPMKSKTVAMLCADLGVTKTHSRPYTSNDNPYSESQFKTLKYRPDFPERFGCIQDARQFLRSFFNWYNHEHHHSGIALLTPACVHFDLSKQTLAKRATVLKAAFEKNSARFKHKVPSPVKLPEAVWINKPENNQET